MSEIGADVVSPRVACLTEGYLLPFVLSPTKKSQTNAHKQKNKNFKPIFPAKCHDEGFSFHQNYFQRGKLKQNAPTEKTKDKINKHIQGDFL